MVSVYDVGSCVCGVVLTRLFNFSGFVWTGGTRFESFCCFGSISYVSFLSLSRWSASGSVSFLIYSGDGGFSWTSSASVGMSSVTFSEWSG